MTADPSPARVAADRGRTERRAADADGQRRTQEAAVTVEPAHPVPAPALERQGDAESREDRISDEALEAAALAVHYLWCKVAGCPGSGLRDRAYARAALAAAVPHLERRIRESIAGEAREFAEQWLYDGDNDAPLDGYDAVVDLAARIARGQVSS